MKTLKHFTRVAVAFAAIGSIQPAEGQAVLNVVKRLEALEAKIAKIESGLAKVAGGPATTSIDPEVSASIAEIRDQIGNLEAEVAAVKEAPAESDVSAEVDDLREQLDAVKAALTEGDEEVPSEENAELIGLLDELREIIAQARALEEEAKESPYSFTGRVHAQFNTRSPEDQLSSEFLIRRARITAKLKINDLVTGKIQPDFGAGKITLKDAYFKLGFSPHANVTVGQFKRPFDIFTLTSSTQSLVIETQGKVRGAGDCAGPGGICSYNRFTEKLGFSDRDIGVQLDGKFSDPRWSYKVSVTNGEGANRSEQNSTKSFGARVEYRASSRLKVAANVAYHDYENPVDTTLTHAPAYGVDVEWGSFSSGWHVQAGVLTGDNWKNLLEDGTPSSLRAAQGIVSYRFPVTSTAQVAAIEPLVRLSWADPAESVELDDEIFATAGVVFHFVGRNKIAWNIEAWDPAFGDREWSMKVQSYLHF